MKSEPLRFVATVESALGSVLAEGSEGGGLLAEAARRLALGQGAKRVRPRLVLAAAAGRDAQLETLVDIAVASELIHTASLLHDDVVDEGELRRGQPTANAIWGNAVAVLSGDMVLSLALERLRRLPVALLVSAVEVVLRMSRASLLELSSRGTLELGTVGWQGIAVGKTAELFGWCCAAPALLSGDDETAERWRGCGKHLGVAFQLADDLSDLLPHPTGKDRFADLAERTPSYPILLGANASNVLRDRILALWSAPDVDAKEVAVIGADLMALGVEELTREAIGRELELARAELGGAGIGDPLVDEMVSLWGGAAHSRGEGARQCVAI
jgi:geranylgeranyl pyrophosphate synthase